MGEVAENLTIKDANGVAQPATVDELMKIVEDLTRIHWIPHFHYEECILRVGTIYLKMNIKNCFLIEMIPCLDRVEQKKMPQGRSLKCLVGYEEEGRVNRRGQTPIEGQYSSSRISDSWDQLGHPRPLLHAGTPQPHWEIKFCSPGLGNRPT